jgi:ParB family chromosome partitioning protein
VSAKSRGLGRGLDALLPKAEKGPQMLPLEQLRAAPGQPRKKFDPAAMAELASSVAEKGVLQPLLVRPVAGGYEIVAGERRFRAAKEAGLSDVPVVIRELSDREALEIAIVENLQREDLSPVEEARAFQQLVGMGSSQEAVGKAVGKSRSAVANSLRLLTLPDATLEALEAGEITAGHARAVLAQPEADRAWALERIVDGQLTVRQAEALKRESRPSRDVSDGRYRQLEEGLTRHAGTRVQVKGGNRGRIELHFHSEDELERLLELLGYQH